MYSQKTARRSKPKARGLRKVLRFRKGVSARRRSRALREEKTPLQPWNHPKRKSHWGIGPYTHIVDASGNRPRPGKSSATITPVSTVDSKHPVKDDKLIQIANQSMLSRLGSGVKKFLKVKRSS